MSFLSKNGFLAATLASVAFCGACSNSISGLGTGGSGAAGASSGAGASGGSGGSGGAPFCEPNLAEICYSGAPGSNGVGLCTPGIRRCAADGSEFGPCQGEIAAITEVCGATSCQGAAACNVSGLWSKGFESTGQTGASAMVVDAQGNVILTGYLSGEVDFGDDPMAVESALGGFLAKFDPSGNLLWSERLGGDDAVWTPVDLVVDPAGDLLLIGYLNGGGTLDLGGGPLLANGPSDAVVARFDADGHPLWSRVYGGDGYDFGARIALAPSGEIVLMGHSLANVEHPYLDPGGESIFLAKLASSGTLLWERKIDAHPTAYNGGLAVALSGDILMTGDFSGVTDLGGGPFDAQGNSHAFLARFDPSGNPLWSRAFGGTGVSATATDVVVDVAGNETIVGHYTGPLDLGGGALLGQGTQPFVAAFNPGGAALWSRSLWGTDTIGNAYRLALANDGSLLVGGTFSYKVDVDNGISGDEIFVSRFAPSGEPLWSVVYGGPISQMLNDLALDGSGDVLLTGAFDGEVDFGTGPLPATVSQLSLFIAKVSP